MSRKSSSPPPEYFPPADVDDCRGASRSRACAGTKGRATHKHGLGDRSSERSEKPQPTTTVQTSSNVCFLGGIVCAFKSEVPSKPSTELRNFLVVDPETNQKTTKHLGVFKNFPGGNRMRQQLG